jgi:hypothetical protein
MQTFLPYPSFRKSAKVLDDKRLGKQRSECVIIMKTLLGVYEKEGRKGWPHHPATKMWAGYEKSLWWYAWNVCLVWRDRGHHDTVADWLDGIKTSLPADPIPSEEPPWFGNEEFHRSHRSNLLRKMPEHYRQYWPDERDDLPYIWPV